MTTTPPTPLTQSRIDEMREEIQSKFRAMTTEQYKANRAAAAEYSAVLLVWGCRPKERTDEEQEKLNSEMLRLKEAFEKTF